MTNREQMNKSTEFFDEKLDLIEHYQKFPVMKPFVGKNYGQGNSRKIMFVAESHYLPPNSTISRNPEKWYESNQKDLTNEEIEWINTRKILGGNWKPAGHMIFRELDKRLSKHLDTTKFRAMTNVVFMNGFQRPAPETGDSIKNFCKPIDYKIGADTIKRTIRILEPNLVIFVSKLAWDKLRWKLPKTEFETEFNFVCHPGTGGLYWHNKKYKHGLNKFNTIIDKELNKNVLQQWL